MEPIRVWIEGFLRGRYGFEGYRAFLVLAVPLVAVGVVGASLLLQTPTYEASVHMSVGVRYPAQGTGNGKIQLIPNAPRPKLSRRSPRG